MRLPKLNRRALEVFLAVLASIGFALAFSYPIWANITGLGLDHDWDYAMEMQWIPFYTVTHFHQFPLWDPYKCGGLPLLANPQSRILTPFFFFDLLFGPLVGIHLEIIAHVAIGFGGAYLLARVADIRWLGAAACGAVFAGSSWYYLHVTLGHATFMSGMYVPLIVALFWMGWRRRQPAFSILTGLFTALIFFEGGIYQITYLGLMLALLAIVLSAQYRSVFPILLLAATGFFALAFCGPKLLPMLKMMGPYGRWVDPFEKNSLWMFGQELFSRDQEFMRDSMGGFWGFWEFGAYIGVVFPALAILGIALRFRRALPWLIVALVVLALAAGNHGPYSPWVLLHRLPLFSAQHAPTRMFMVLTLCVGMLAGLAIDALCSQRRLWLTGLTAIVILIASYDYWQVSPPNLRYVLGGGETDAFKTDPIFQQYYFPNEHRMFMMAQANLGIVGCYEPASGGNNAYAYNQAGYRGEQYLVGEGTVSLVRWTPNVLDFEVDAKVPATVVVNQNFSPEWKVVRGTGEIYKSSGLICVRVPPGKQRLELRYYSISFLYGCLMFLIGIISAASIWPIERRFRVVPRRGRGTTPLIEPYGDSANDSPSAG